MRASRKLNGGVRWAAFAVLILAAAGCDCDEQTFPADQSHRVAVTEGVWGRVWVRGTDPIPVANGCSTPQEIVPASRTLLFYDVADSAEVVGARWADSEHPVVGVLYDAVLSPLVDSITSDETGFFELALAPGDYSVLVRLDEALFWPNGFLGASPVSPVTVPEGGTVAVEIDILSLLPL